MGQEPDIAVEMNTKASQSASRSRLSLIMMGAGVTALVTAATLFVLTFTGVLDDGSGSSGPGTVTGFGRIDLAGLQAQAPQSTPTPAPLPPSDAPISRMVIPAIEVDAPISVKGVGADGVMEAPDGPWDISWYDFTARPGFGGNAVFSGHVDYIDVGPAVLWRLNELAQDDLVEVLLQDGTVYQYHLVAMENVDAENVDVGSIVGPTEQEIVTIITCAGTFNRSSGQYDQRLIIRAVRVTNHVEPPRVEAAPDR